MVTQLGSLRLVVGARLGDARTAGVDGWDGALRPAWVGFDRLGGQVGQGERNGHLIEMPVK